MGGDNQFSWFKFFSQLSRTCKVTLHQNQKVNDKIARRFDFPKKTKDGLGASFYGSVHNKFLDDPKPYSKLDMIMQIYVSKDNQQYGPYTVEQLRGFVDGGNFTIADLACSDGQNWVKISGLPGWEKGTPRPAVPPPPPKNKKMLTDIITRSKKLLGASVEFATGLDEHGQKEQQGGLETKPIDIELKLQNTEADLIHEKKLRRDEKEAAEQQIKVLNDDIVRLDQENIALKKLLG
jgi:hypothetical protein